MVCGRVRKDGYDAAYQEESSSRTGSSLRLIVVAFLEIALALADLRDRILHIFGKCVCVFPVHGDAGLEIAHQDRTRGSMADEQVVIICFADTERFPKVCRYLL